jgi:hypothetical protein
MNARMPERKSISIQGKRRRKDLTARTLRKNAEGTEKSREERRRAEKSRQDGGVTKSKEQTRATTD